MTVTASNTTRTMTSKDAMKLIQIERSSEQIEGQKWYIIDNKWWADFAQQAESAKNDNESIKMPPISNADHMEKNEEGFYTLKPDLAMQVHINLIPEKVFFELKKTYGIIDEEIDVVAREVVKGTLMKQEPFIEIYPLIIKVANYHNKDEVLTIPISQADSIEKIRKAIMDRLEIQEKDRRNAQFFIEDNGNYEALPETISHIKLSALLNSGSTVFVNSLGTASEILSSTNNGSTRAGTRYSAGRNNTTYQRGVCGLQNLGNTCFMNSALQCLSNVPELTEYFLIDAYAAEINHQNPLGTQGRLVSAYAELLQEMWSGNSSSVRPWKLKCVIGEFAPRFNGYAQQDSQELTAFLLDGLHEDLNRIKKKPYIEEKEVEGRDEVQAAQEAWNDYKKRNDSQIVDLLHGQLKSTLTCNVCQKVSIKFDPFCFLSVQIPAKEKQMKSTITFIRKQKWAKFSITHTNKTIVRQIADKLREQLKISNETQIVLLTFFASEIIPDDQQLCAPYGYTKRQFYAYAVEEPGPIMLVENRIMAAFGGQTLGVAFPVVRPKKITRQFVLDQVLPRCRDYFWQERCGSSTSAEDKLNANEGIGGAVDQSELVPTEIILNNVNETKDYPFPEVANKEVVYSSEADDSSSPVKLILKWKETRQFQNVNVDNLVDREVNMNNTLRKAYTLKECIDLYTTREQLNEEDSWYCPRCKTHQRAFKKLDLWALPQILIIHLKRFIYSRYTRDKIDTEIEIPVRGLDLSEKVLDPTHKQEKYDLIGVDNHSGGLGSGHYTARALNGNTWCEFNDSSAYQTNPLGDTFTSREAYMLVYRRRDNPQTIRKSPRIAAAAAAQTETSPSNTSNMLSSNVTSGKGSTGNAIEVRSEKRRVSETRMETD